MEDELAWEKKSSVSGKRAVGGYIQSALVAPRRSWLSDCVLQGTHSWPLTLRATAEDSWKHLTSDFASIFFDVGALKTFLSRLLFLLTSAILGSTGVRGATVL